MRSDIKPKVREEQMSAIQHKLFGLAIAAGVIGLVMQAPAAAQTTEVGTPRAETLIVDQLGGTVTSPFKANPYASITNMGQGGNQMAFSPLWEIHTPTGEMFPFLAAEMPKALNDDFTEFEIKLRAGITWSDGESFNADDVVFTAQMLLDNEDIPIRGVVVDNLESMTKVDDLTVRVKTTKPLPRFEKVFGSVIWGPSFRVVPEHVFRDEDVMAFDFYPPVTTAPYVVVDGDPNGNWKLWKKRDDWADSDLAVLNNGREPAPNYILWRFYGPEEKRVLAMAQNDLDVLMDISPDGWDVLRNANPNTEVWFPGFPWANMDDPCERGIHFNTRVAPYDQWQVRWALALATNIVDVSINTFNGMLRVSPLNAPPIQVLMETYHQPMADWLGDFALPDGYKPFDPDVALRIAEWLRADGAEGLPETDEELRALFGVGWWKQDTEKAAELLESVGFSRDDDGKWLLPDGTPWTLFINAPADFEVLSQRLAFAVANVWRAFGVNVEVQQLQGGPFWTNYNTGDYQAGSYWWPNSCAVAPDLFHGLETWHERYVKDVGVSTGNNRERYSTPEISALIDQIVALPSDDPQIVPLWTEVLQELVVGMPVIDMVGTSKFVPVNTTYWKNFPSSENYYEGPWWWWTTFKVIVGEIEPSGS